MVSYRRVLVAFLACAGGLTPVLPPAVHAAGPPDLSAFAQPGQILAQQPGWRLLAEGEETNRVAAHDLYFLRFGAKSEHRFETNGRITGYGFHAVRTEGSGIQYDYYASLYRTPALARAAYLRQRTGWYEHTGSRPVRPDLFGDPDTDIFFVGHATADRRLWLLGDRFFLRGPLLIESYISMTRADFRRLGTQALQQQDGLAGRLDAVALALTEPAKGPVHFARHG